ncbi:MAG: flagellar basal body-associated FliL family protein [Lachnospiraceae bacterium]
MKKNLLSILILALLVVNLIMTGIMMFSVLNQSRKTADLVGKIAQAVDLELSAEEGEEEETAVSMGDTAVYVLSEELTIPLARGEDDRDHYFIVSVSLSMNMKDKDYKTYGTEEAMQEKEGLIRAEIISVIGQYTLDECRANMDMIRQEILERLQTMYGSKFIFNVSFSDTVFS